VVVPAAAPAAVSTPALVVAPVAAQSAQIPSVVSVNLVGEAAPTKMMVPTIQPETLLWVSVAEDPSLNGRYLVNNQSAIDFGYVGLVFLVDMNVDQAENAIRNALEGRYLNRATVSVKIAKASYDQVSVLGAVDMPAQIKIGAGATISLNEALRRAGGLRGNRDNARVKIVRGGMRTPFGPAAPGEVYILSSSEGRLQVPDIFLRNNDLAYVFTYETATAIGGGKRILLLGEVPRRGVVDFSENEPCTVMYLLFKIGGLPRFARADRIQVVRTTKDGREKTFVVNGSDLMTVGDPKNDLVLESGDRVIVRARRFAFF
jgi:protein involved in polysaccharide export with SLBB domain